MALKLINQLEQVESSEKAIDAILGSIQVVTSTRATKCSQCGNTIARGTKHAKAITGYGMFGDIEARMCPHCAQQYLEHIYLEMLEKELIVPPVIEQEIDYSVIPF